MIILFVALEPLSKINPDHQRLYLDDPKSIVSRLKTPSKGYWSDHDAYPSTTKKKQSGLAPLTYKTFTGAHRYTGELEKK